MNKNLTTDIVFVVEKFYLLMNIKYIETSIYSPILKSFLHMFIAKNTISTEVLFERNRQFLSGTFK
jgi:hypothetical protein